MGIKVTPENKQDQLMAADLKDNTLYLDKDGDIVLCIEREQTYVYNFSRGYLLGDSYNYSPYSLYNGSVTIQNT